MTTVITRDLIESYLNCPYKAHLKAAAKEGTPSEYGLWHSQVTAEARRCAIERVLASHPAHEIDRDVALTQATLERGTAFLLISTLEDGDIALTFDGLQRLPGPSKLGEFHYAPLLFSRSRQARNQQRTLLNVYGLLLSRLQGRVPAYGSIWHGKEPRATRVRLDPDPRKAEGLLQELRQLLATALPPRLNLNKHCSECEFRLQCRAAAVEEDDLSLLAGLSAKEVVSLNRRGIFTVTQYSYTFRPGRMKRATEGAAKKHDQALQALAIRENTVFVARRPELPAGKAHLYLDVEGLPDEDRYYLIGLTIAENGNRCRLSIWADGATDEASMWAAFLAAIGGIGDFALFHYGSYETHFLDRMEARHGGDAELLARIRSRSVNVVSQIHARVYFPAYSNGLKSVAGCLGFKWSARLIFRNPGFSAERGAAGFARLRPSGVDATPRMGQHLEQRPSG